MRRIVRKGFWIEFTVRRAAVEHAGGPLGSWRDDFGEMGFWQEGGFGKRGTRLRGVHFSRRVLEVMAPDGKIVLCRLEPEEFCGKISTFFHIPCTASVRTQSLR